MTASHVPPAAEETALQVARPEQDTFMPLMTIEAAVARHRAIVRFTSELLNEGTDYGKIPGTDKPTLLKPGAEKLCTLFGLTPRFTIVEKIEDWHGRHTESGEPQFYYLYRCSLYRGERLIAEGDGSCNSFEKKYRWRAAQRVCPECSQPTIRKGKGASFFCSGRDGGCGAGFRADDGRITGQQLGRVPNPDIADQVNTLQKMGQKRALIAATLIAVNASEFFTQDREDFVEAEAHEVHDAERGFDTTQETPGAKPISQDQFNEIGHLAKEMVGNHLWADVNELQAFMQESVGVASRKELNSGQADAVIAALKEKLNDTLQEDDVPV